MLIKKIYTLWDLSRLLLPATYYGQNQYTRKFY